MQLKQSKDGQRNLFPALVTSNTQSLSDSRSRILLLSYAEQLGAIMLETFKGTLYRIQYYADGIHSGLTPPG